MKFSRPTTEVMKAFAALRSNPNFITVLHYLEDCKRQSDDEHRNVDEVSKLYRNQGGGKVVDEMLRLFQESKRM